jgi:hypothetical protein
LPEVPVKLTVAVAAPAVDAAVNVVLCAVPGVKVSVAGLAVTPLGRPVMVTATVLLKELIAVARRLTFKPASPATRVSDAGAAEMEKSAAGAAAVTVAATAAEWLRVPEVPVRVIVVLLAAALAAAVRVSVCALPGVKVSVAGLAVTPLGRPLMATATVLLKELIAVARTLTFEPVAPATSATDGGETEREKSAAGAVVVTVAATVAE